MNPNNDKIKGSTLTVEPFILSARNSLLSQALNLFEFVLHIQVVIAV